MAKTAAFERLSTSDRIREVLLGRILDGTYKPGDRIIEMDIARELETSQAPVREALRELQGLRLVTVKPYRGACVREVTEQEMLEALEIRSALEEFAARRAAADLSGHVADLRLGFQGMRAAAEKGDVDAFARHDLAFHRVIVETADHGVLLRTWESLGVETRIRMFLKRTGVDLNPVAEAHLPIIEAIESGATAEAEHLLRAHPEAIYRVAGLEWAP
ncbi:MAG: GntR family transcriptional regulator [Gemmatimonadota bacterium]